MSNQNTWAIIANASQIDKAWMLPYLSDYQLIVCDGAYDYVKNWNISIDTILGDFDSTQYPTHTSHFVHTPDQNKTDLHKAIDYADKQGATQIIIFNALGNQMSHTLHNLRLLKRLHSPKRSLCMLHTMHDPNTTFPSSSIESIQYLHDTTTVLEGPIEASISLFGFPQCIASSYGLVWDLDQTTLEFSEYDSSRNRLATTNAALTIQGEGLLMMDTHIQTLLTY
jgi:thiamine pyrophosphokinase